MPYNRKALEQVREWARGEKNGIRLDMGNWVKTEDGTEYSCLTAACIGGWTVHHAGAEFIWPQHMSSAVRQCRLDGIAMYVSEAAARILGITEEEAYVLFDLNQENPEEDPDGPSLAFLDYLVKRAQKGLRNMSDEEVDDWVPDN